ncbi:hypothetical protein WP12_06280 [Sphingomonas sp. SRS2]|nr:hypothetical protein WP12_06280 [Sphingomonas sp. SRS2]
MLFLSHLDRDHITGVPQLLDKRAGVAVDTIVLPYLDELDRIIAFSRSADTEGEASIERFHADMVLDPVATLNQFEPRQVILIPATDDEGLAGLLPTDPPFGRGDDFGWTTEALSGGGSPDVHSDAAGAIVLRRAEFALSLRGECHWRLRPYVRRAREEDRQAFMTATELLLGWPRGSFRDKTSSTEQRRVLVTRDCRSACKKDPLSGVIGV